MRDSLDRLVRNLNGRARSLITYILARRGYELTCPADRALFEVADLSNADRQIVACVAPYTLTNVQRRATLLAAIDYLVRYGIEGDIAECGVWRGGSVMLSALKLLERGDRARSLYLYDTFEGMSQPTEVDRSFTGELAKTKLDRTPRGEGVWCEAGLDDVRNNLLSTGYPAAQIQFVKGKVEDTLPSVLPRQLALLRIDTDWYESTLHSLRHLFPLLIKNGVLILDDYGHWEGARRAVDEYFEQLSTPLFLHRIDYSARLLIKRS